MKQKTLFLILGIEAVFCMAICFINSMLLTDYTSIITFPFAQISSGLRSLSLSGAVGNIIAIILYVGVCILPLIFMFIKIKRKKFKIEDVLLAIMSIFLFILVYLMINPAYIPVLIILLAGEGVLCGTLYSIIIGYVTLKLLRRFTISETHKLIDYFKILLAVIGMVLVYDIFGTGISKLISTFESIKTSNTGATELYLIATYVYLIFRYVISSISTILDVAIIFFTNKLLNELKLDRYGEGVIKSANELKRMCITAIIVTVFSYIIINAGQLILSKILLNTSYTTQIPLISITLVLIVMLLSKYFAQTKALKNDNDMFI